MTAFSKMAAPPSSRPLLQAAKQIGENMQVRQGGHGPRTMHIDTGGHLTWSRVKDMAHFYTVVPLMVIAMWYGWVQIVYGRCELTDPKEDDPPRFWQYERTPIRQWLEANDFFDWVVKYLGVSDIENNERNMAFFYQEQILSQWRREQARVRHLQAQRLDYKAWNYYPMKTYWADNERVVFDNFWHNITYARHNSVFS